MSRAAHHNSGHHMVATLGLNDSQKVTRPESSREGVYPGRSKWCRHPIPPVDRSDSPIKKSLAALLTVIQPCNCHCNDVPLGYVCGLLVTN